MDEKFFNTSRGKIILELRDGAKTVNDLAATLGLTDNAVRASLLTLERDRLIEQSGTIKGHRKPHFAYRLTENARKLFPRSYDSLFNVLMTELKQVLNPSSLIGTLRSVGQKIGRRKAGSDATLDERVAETLAKLEELGGAPKIVSSNGTIVIASNSCPFAEVVGEHPEVCQVAEAMVAEMVDQPVTEMCDRTGSPKCCFEIRPAR